ncbi:brain tumor protein-like [Branchiostoma floridae]|uniref:Brain tumor protein-like n=1 Tax=Branchiostoma floridae TaxID=7739 RepID=A0A9J7LZW7_BRAFL|nr:brain tumor protein-like [Branchiostoma floridae]
MQAVNQTISKITFGGRGSKAGRFSGLNNAAVSPSNEIFVADTLNRTVQVFNMEGAYLRKFPTVVSGEGSEAMDPLDISIDGEGHLWVIGETDTSEIIVSYTKKGRHIITIHPSSPNITFHDIAVDKLRNYVTITTAEQEVSGAGDVTVLLYNGTVVRKIETPQWWPNFIAVDKNGRYLVTDMYKTDLVYIYSETGQYQLSLGGKGRILMPVGIYVDSSGNILVADEYDSSVEMFTDSGEHVRRVEPGVMFTGMALAPGGQLVLVNQMYSNVTILSRY